MRSLAELEAEPLSLVLLHQGNQPWALPASEVIDCRLDALASHSSQQARTFDAAALCPHPLSTSSKPWQLLTLKGRKLPWQLRFQGEVEFAEVRSQALHPLPSILERRKTWPAVKALLTYQQGLCVLLDAYLLEDQALGC